MIDTQWLNSKQIDKNSKTLLDLRARCNGDQNKSQEAKGPHSFKDQVSNAAFRMYTNYGSFSLSRKKESKTV